MQFLANRKRHSTVPKSTILEVPARITRRLTASAARLHVDTDNWDPPLTRWPVRLGSRLEVSKEKLKRRFEEL